MEFKMEGSVSMCQLHAVVPGGARGGRVCEEEYQGGEQSRADAHQTSGKSAMRED
jgi:hypothetical protein